MAQTAELSQRRFDIAADEELAQVEPFARQPQLCEPTLRRFLPKPDGGFIGYLIQSIRDQTHPRIRPEEFKQAGRVFAEMRGCQIELHESKYIIGRMEYPSASCQTHTRGFPPTSSCRHRRQWKILGTNYTPKLVHRNPRT